MKTIYNLRDDIYSLFGSGHVPNEDNIIEFAHAVSNHVVKAFAKREVKGELRASNIGTPCQRQLHYKVHSPEDEEEVQPNTKLKFLYGHIIEELAVLLIKETGREVQGQQETIEVDGVQGHMDGIVSGTIIDVKSANSRGMEKFEKHKLEEDDPFGYLDQINFYAEGSKEDERVTNKDEVAFVAIDKELGHIVVDIYRKRPSEVTRQAIAEKLLAVAHPAVVPPRGFMPQPDGKSGNMALGLECRYCGWKKKCWPGMRTFLYSNGPKFLTRVEREPDVPEIK